MGVGNEIVYLYISKYSKIVFALELRPECAPPQTLLIFPASFAFNLLVKRVECLRAWLFLFHVLFDLQVDKILAPMDIFLIHFQQEMD